MPVNQMLDVSIRKQLESFELDVTFSAPLGITSLLGKSGAGKSMTLACIAGLETPDSGRIVLGNSVFFDHDNKINVATRHRRVGFVMQDYLLFPHLDVGHNVAFGLKGLSRAERDVVVEDALARVGLEAYRDRSPEDLSGGQQQRVALARALVTNPSALLLDEPFSALDGPTRAVLRRDLLDLQRTLELPVIFVTHDLGEAYLLADQIVVIEDGRVIQIGPPGTIVYRPATQSVARLTGNNNFFEGELVAREAEGTLIRVGELTLAGPPIAFPEGMPVELGIRPERIMLLRKDLPVGNRANIFPGRVVNEMTDGFNYTLFFRLNGDKRLAAGGYDLEITLPAHVYERLRVDKDKDWSVTIRRNDIHVFGAG
jgi:molybdate transport system ATP-binding protein